MSYHKNKCWHLDVIYEGDKDKFDKAEDMITSDRFRDSDGWSFTASFDLNYAISVAKIVSVSSGCTVQVYCRSHAERALDGNRYTTDYYIVKGTKVF